MPRELMTIFIFSYILVFHSHSFEEQTSAPIHTEPGLIKFFKLSLKKINKLLNKTLKLTIFLNKIKK